MMRTVIGLLSDAREARRTAEELEGIGARDISIISKDGTSSGPLAAYLAPTGAGAGADGGITALERVGLSRQEAQRYLDGLRSGYTLEAAMVEDDRAEQALAIMRQHATDFGRAGGTNRSGTRGGGEAVVPVVAERLSVDKREVDAGGVRVTSTVQEVPVREQVQLREERIDVQRRPADRPLGRGEQPFREQTFEVKAISEEPVVTKEARVVEEIVVKKDENVRTQAIEETVRREDVNVQQLGTRYGQHFRQNYARGGQARFDEYAPAYEYGHGLRQNKAFENRAWDDIEPNARADWERNRPGTWERFKDAVRHAWEDVTT